MKIEKSPNFWLIFRRREIDEGNVTFNRKNYYKKFYIFGATRVGMKKVHQKLSILMKIWNLRMIAIFCQEKYINKGFADRLAKQAKIITRKN